MLALVAARYLVIAMSAECLRATVGDFGHVGLPLRGPFDAIDILRKRARESRGTPN